MVEITRGCDLCNFFSGLRNPSLYQVLTFVLCRENFFTLKIQNMKKAILLLVAIGFITIAATTKTSLSNDKVVVKSTLNDEKYKACIAACNECIRACNSCEVKCSDVKHSKMADCTQFCKDCVVACKAANKAMNANSQDAAVFLTACAQACEKCATECEKFDISHCKKCAIDCRAAEKLCNECSAM